MSSLRESEWQVISLKNYIETLESGKRPKGGASKEGVPSIGAGNLQWNGDFNFERMKYVPDSFYQQINVGKLQVGDVLVVKDGATTGKVGYVDEGFIYKEAACINEHVFLLRTKEGLNPKYLFYFLLSEEGRINILRDFRGATVGGITRNFIDMSIPLPPYDIQQKIIEMLDCLRLLIKKRQQANDLIQHYLQAIFYEMFGDPATNHKDWEIGIIGDITHSTHYGSSRKASIIELSYPILRMNNITYEGEWDFTSLKYIDLSEGEKKKHLVYKGELLFNRTNSKQLVGKTAVYREDEPMAYAGYLIKVVTNEKGNSEFLSAYLNSPYGKSILQSMAKSIVGMANINAEELKSISIYLPPLELQIQYADLVQSVELLKRKQRISTVQVRTLFLNVLNHFFKRS